MLEAKAFRERIFQRLPALANEGRCRVPNQRFWDFYHDEKEMFCKACIGVRKVDDDWLIIAYDFVDHDLKSDQEQNEMLARHQSECFECDHPCALERTRMKNGYPRYYFYCQNCQRRKSSALPHKLVDHLIASGREVFDHLK